MAFDSSYLDEKNWKIVVELQPKRSHLFAEWAGGFDLLPAVAERVRKNGNAGVITGVRAEIDPAKSACIAALIAQRRGRCAGAH